MGAEMKEKNQCTKCPYKPANRSNLKKHFLSVHEKVKRFHCDKCPYEAAYKHSIKSHVLAVHEKMKEFHCDKCPYLSLIHI